MKTTIGVLAVLAGLCAAVPACRRPDGQRSTLREPVELTFDVYNHTQGRLKTYIRRTMPFSEIKLRVEDFGVGGVDPDRIVVRERRLGRLRAAANGGVAVFTAPESDMSYSVYLANASAGADYRVVDYWVGPLQGVLRVGRRARLGREDRNGYSGPESVIWAAVDQLNDALSYPWADYGRLERVEPEGKADIFLGYGHCRDALGWHSWTWAGINPVHCRTEKVMLATFLEEIFELVTGTSDIGRRDTAEVITDPGSGRLNDVGRDLLAYVYVKDER